MILIIAELCFCIYNAYSVSKQFLKINKEYLNIHTKNAQIKLFKRILKENLLDYIKNSSYSYFDSNEFRMPSIISVSKTNKNIVTAGCSFAYGAGLNDNETFSAVLSKYTHSNVYNIAIPGASPRELLYILRNPELLDKLIPPKNIQYFIYVYIYDHKRRLYSNMRPIVPFFKTVKYNNLSPKNPEQYYTGLKFIKIPNTINSFYTIKYINNFLYNHQYFKNSNILLNMYIKEIHKEIKKNFGDTKFVIFVYNNEGNENFQELENDGIIIIKSSDILKENLNDLKYKIYDKEHPNAKAWEVIVPAFAKELNL